MNSRRETQRLSTSMSVDIQHLSKTDWRVSVACPSSQGEDAILGFVEQLEPHRFEIVWMSNPPRWAYADSLDAAVSAVVDGMQFSGEVCAERDEALRYETRGDEVSRPIGRTHHRETWVKSHRGAHVA